MVKAHINKHDTSAQKEGVIVAVPRGSVTLDIGDEHISLEE